MSTASPALSLLAQQQEHLQVLLSLLQAEFNAISARDIAALEQGSSQKIACLEEIQKLDLQLSQFPGLSELKQQSWFVESVQAVDSVLGQCKEQNELNRLTLEQSQLVIERFKHELLQNRGKSGLTYNAKGKPNVDSLGKGIKA
jgi:flagella synthesis protein FlgN